jgi:hypothetical protein
MSGRSEPSPETLAVERRAWVRYGTDLEVVCHAGRPVKDVGWTARVRDISAGGVGLLLQHRFRPGTPLVIQLKGRGESWCRAVGARVVHATPVWAEDGAWWLVGCAFSSPLSEEELRILV